MRLLVFLLLGAVVVFGSLSRGLLQSHTVQAVGTAG